MVAKLITHIERFIINNMVTGIGSSIRSKVVIVSIEYSKYSSLILLCIVSTIHTDGTTRWTIPACIY